VGRAPSTRSCPPTGSKETRAAPVAARAEAAELWICHGPCNTDFLDKLISFPAGSHDDQVDTLSGAYGELAEHRESFVAFPILIPKEEPWPDWSYH
jgi:predicted phage terminase large subunit-like protein